MTNKVTFVINISDKYTMKCSYIDSNNIETTIELHNNPQQEYLFSGSINFLDDLFTNPHDFKFYNIELYGKEYSVIAEVLFALIISEFKKQIEKEFIIENTIVQLPSNNLHLSNRIQISLESIGLNNITMNPILFEYKDQGAILEELLENKEEKKKRERMIEKSNKIAKEQNIPEIEINDYILTTEQEFQKALTKYSIQERNKMKLYKLDNYCIFIASRYLESIDDHKNLTRVCKRLRYNMEKFHYNPVSVNKKTVKFFPNIQTLHCYSNIDKYLEGGRIIYYIDWRRRSCNDFEYIKEINSDKVIEFKHVVFTEKDVEEEKRKQNPHYDSDFKYKIEIPNGVKEIDENAFGRIWDLREIHIPETVKIIPMKCFEKCKHLTSITIQLNETRVIHGNKIFNNQEQLNQCFYLPSSNKFINGEEVNQLTSITIPSHVKSFDDNCFNECNELKQLILPESFTNISREFLLKLPKLEELILLSQYELHGDRLFIVKDNLLASIQLHSSIKKINGKKIQLEQLTSYTIPSNVTKLHDYCFANCNELTEIQGLEQIKEFGRCCLTLKLKNDELQLKNDELQLKNDKSKLKNDELQLKIDKLQLQKEDLWQIVYDLDGKQKQQLEKWTGLKCLEVLFDSIVDAWAYKTTVLDEKIIGKKQLIFLIEDEDGEKFGYYLNSKVDTRWCYTEVKTDNKAFEFNLESNGRLNEPMKFELTANQCGKYKLYHKMEDNKLIELGDIILFKEEYKSQSTSKHFEAICYHHGIKYALSGKEHFTPKRILVIQMGKN